MILMVFLSFWDASSFKLLDVSHQNRHEADITMAKFLDPYPILVSVGNDGAMKMYTVRPYHMPYICVMQAYNVTYGEDKNAAKQNANNQAIPSINSIDAVAFQSMSWDHTKFEIITGDANGNISTWDDAGHCEA